MAPTLTQAKHRRWWIACTAIIENLMFAAVLLGWSSLLLMLKKEGFYSYLCTDEGQLNSTVLNYTTVSPNETTTLSLIDTSEQVTEGDVHASPYPTCTEQDEMLNRYFSIGSSLLSAVTVVLGVIMDKYGCRLMRLCGCWTFMLSCVCFAAGSLDTERLSFLIAPAVCLNGMGGIVYVFTSFQIPNLFENIRSTMIALMIGSYSASAVLYMVFKMAYDAGVPFAWLMMIHAVIGFFTFINAYMNIPQEPIPGPGDVSYAIDMAGDKSGDQEVGSFVKVLFAPCVLWSFVMMCVVQLRLIAFMGSLEMYLKASAKKNDLDPTETANTIDTYTLIFGVLQVNCFFMAPVIGTINDWRLKHFTGVNESYKGKSKKAQLIQNLTRAFTLTNTLMLIFGIIVLFEKHIQLQVVAFVLHTAIRTFLHSSMGALYACMYHFSHFGKLTGLSSFLSALFILVQDPLFVLVNSSLGGDPFWVNVGLLVLALTGFGLPMYLWRFLRTHNEEFAVKGTHNNGVALSAIQEADEDCADGSVHYLNGSTVSNGIVKGLADEQEVHASINAITF